MLEYMYIVYGCAVEPVGTQGAPFLVDRDPSYEKLNYSADLTQPEA